MEKKYINIRLLSLHELEEFIETINFEKYRTNQIYDWIWKKDIDNFNEIKNLPKTLITSLEKHFCIEKLAIKEEQFSDDKTIKIAFLTNKNELAEGVLIPTDSRSTACISTQTGCALNCSFCATAKIKKPRNLEQYEIIDQVKYINTYSEKVFNRKLSNIVYMGMGEPLLNYENLIGSINLIISEYGLGFSPTRITVSTAGISNKINQLADDNTKFKLAVSLHSADDKIRDKLMPINKKYNLKSLTESLKYYNKKTNQRITFEYLLLEDINDNLEDAKKLTEFCKSFPSKINIIEYNKVSGSSFNKSSKNKRDDFINHLESKNLIVKIRNSRGQDINAACGQLANSLKINNSD